MAVKLYESGAVPTKKAAADAVGIGRQTIYGVTAPGMGNDEVRRIANDVNKMIDNSAISSAQIIEHLSRKALGIVNTLMTSADKDEVKLKAAQDALDRNPATSKINKHQVESFTMSGKDAQAIAEAMVMSARSRGKYLPNPTDDYVRVGSLDEGQVKRLIEGQRNEDGQDVIEAIPSSK